MDELDDYVAEAMADPEFRAAYEACAAAQRRAWRTAVVAAVLAVLVVAGATVALVVWP